MPKLIWLLFAGMAIFAALLGGVPRDSAQAKCNPGRPYAEETYLDGWRKWIGSQIGGAYAQIYNYDPWVQPGGVYMSDDSTAWTMVTAAPSRYAQVGWQERPYGFRYTFIEWIDSGGYSHYNNQWVPQPENTYTYYTMLYNNYAPGWVSFQVAGQTIAVVNPGWVPVQGEIYGETHNRNTQMAGGRNNHEVIQNSRIWYNNNWQDSNGAPYATNRTYHDYSKLSSRVIHIWDVACAS